MMYLYPVLSPQSLHVRHARLPMNFNPIEIAGVPFEVPYPCVMELVTAGLQETVTRPRVIFCTPGFFGLRKSYATFHSNLDLRGYSLNPFPPDSGVLLHFRVGCFHSQGLGFTRRDRVATRILLCHETSYVFGVGRSLQLIDHSFRYVLVWRAKKFQTVIDTRLISKSVIITILMQRTNWFK